MKKLNIFLVMAACFITLGLVLVACEDSISADGDDIFSGTWLGTETSYNSSIRIVAANGSYRMWMNGREGLRGTYTVSGNTVTLRYVEVNTYILGGGSDHWVFFTALSNADKAELGGSETIQANIYGNTFTMLGSTYYKQ